ncbi:MAG TPA: hypothetical protein VGN96_18705 [Roseococcus sp.]|jgi:hypothetical protein|nr:hypothetical protein [Roseococcus sp.]
MKPSKLTLLRIDARKARRHTRDIFRRYWTLYGGIRAVFISPYFLGSLLISVACAGFLIQSTWWNLPLSILPNLIAFTLGGYALFVAFGNAKFQELMAGGRKKASPYLMVSTLFTHYLVIQTLSLCLLLIIASRPVSLLIYIFSIEALPSSIDFFLRIIKYLAYFFCFLIFTYAVSGILAIAMALLRISGWFDDFIAKSRKIKPPPDTSS